MSNQVFWLDKKPVWFRWIAYGVVLFDLFGMFVVMPILGTYIIINTIISGKPLVYGFAFASIFFVIFFAGIVLAKEYINDN